MFKSTNIKALYSIKTRQKRPRMLLHTLYSAVYSGFKYEKYCKPITSEDSTLTEGSLAVTSSKSATFKQWFARMVRKTKSSSSSILWLVAPTLRCIIATYCIGVWTRVYPFHRKTIFLSFNSSISIFISSLFIISRSLVYV